jgi:hypothetical protein
MGKKKNYYYDEKNPKCDSMELNENGYPVYKDSKILVHRHIAQKYLNENKPLVVYHHQRDELP